LNTVAIAVLDASAVVALLMKEQGYDIVQRVVKAGAVVPATNAVEALHIARRRGHSRSAEELFEDLEELGVQVEPVGADDVVEAAWLLRRSDEEATRNPKLGTLSLGDATCLAVAKRLDLPVVVSDGAWEILDTGVKVLPFR
jgi:ribonuclease VapC